ncbi:hypothetical protein [Halarchaeum nitratireducens]|uniref:DUF8173 domain-containing protein n=1 Tax=Halarchaeum nitratireducens TaxID=489913 RepID=A0A830GDC0_9EURY|nr:MULTISPECIES: hypothetical protein [Halarchaeum]MBP2252115.1 putative membrane protein [Halarchaeum solikamskense]GGN17026.1 hypothetical protein GCM10009021_17190 [Halarchaeum nitratireducens]
MDPLFVPLQQVDPYGVQQALGVGGRAAGAFLGTMLIGALMLAFAGERVERLVDVVADEPVPSFLWGIGTLVVFVCVAVLLVLTIVGIIVVVPLLVVGAAVYYVGNVLVYVYVGGRAADGFGWETTRWGHLLVGAAFAAVVAALPAVGGLVSFVVSSIGVGAIVHTWYRSHEA